MNFYKGTVVLFVGLMGFIGTVRAEELTMKVREIPEQGSSFSATPNLKDAPGLPLIQDCNSNSVSPNEINESPLDPVEAIVDQIINIGKKVWAIVEQGRPVVNLSTDVGTALPKGARCWTDLDSWQMPQSKLYEVSFENAYKMKVVHFVYRVTYVSGGGVNGVGKYIGYAGIQPVDVQVSWGYQFDASASVPTVFNMGTKEQPVAALQLLMSYKISTVLKTIMKSQLYFVDGNGKFQIMD